MRGGRARCVERSSRREHNRRKQEMQAHIDRIRKAARARRAAVLAKQ